nr:DMT family transporter [Mycolicibacterium fluoranthenivorans]
MLAVALVWGSSYLAAKEVVHADGVFAFLALRFGMAVWGLMLVLGRRVARIGRDDVIAGSLFGVILAAICVGETYGVTMTSASNAGLIMALTVVITPLLGGRGAVAPLFYAPAAMVVLGCVALTQSGGGFALPGAGDVLIVGAAALRAVHVTVMSRTSKPRRLDPTSVTLVQLTTVAVLTALPAAALGQFSAVPQMSGRGWALTAYLALACTVFAFGAQMWAVRYSTPARMSLLLGTEPLWVVVIGVGVAGDPVTALGALGALMVVSGTLWAAAVDSATVSGPARRGKPTRSGRLGNKRGSK